MRKHKAPRKPQPPKTKPALEVKLEKSETTGNWMIMLADFRFASAMLKSDAEAIASWVQDRLTKNVERMPTLTR